MDVYSKVTDRMTREEMLNYLNNGLVGHDNVLFIPIDYRINTVLDAKNKLDKICALEFNDGTIEMRRTFPTSISLILLCDSVDVCPNNWKLFMEVIGSASDMSIYCRKDNTLEITLSFRDCFETIPIPTECP